MNHAAIELIERTYIVAWKQSPLPKVWLRRKEYIAYGSRSYQVSSSAEVPFKGYGVGF